MDVLPQPDSGDTQSQTLLDTEGHVFYGFYPSPEGAIVSGEVLDI